MIESVFRIVQQRKNDYDELVKERWSSMNWTEDPACLMIRKSETNQDVLSSNAGVNEVNFSSNFDASLKIHQRPKTWMKKDAVHGFHQQPSGEIWMFQIVFNHNGILC